MDRRRAGQLPLDACEQLGARSAPFVDLIGWWVICACRRVLQDRVTDRRGRCRRRRSDDG